MAINLKKLKPPVPPNLYRNKYHLLIIGLMVLVVLFYVCFAFVFYELKNKPLPQFYAVQPDGKETLLIPYDEPNLLPETILRWASKAATAAYTFDFVNYKNQIAAVKPYFTEQGFADYSNSVNLLISRVLDQKIFVYGVVVGTPVISNEGPLPGYDYVWRVQIPFLVSYLSTAGPKKQNYTVVLSIVRVPTNVNKQGIGIDQFLMV